MILLSASNLHKAYGENEIFKDISLEIKSGEIIGLVGHNGSGKTTLLKCLQQPTYADAGEVHLAHNLRIGYLEQLHRDPGDLTVWEAVLAGFNEVLEKRRQLTQLEQLLAGADDTSLPQYLSAYARCQAEYELLDGYALESNVRGILTGLGFAPNLWEMPAQGLSGGEKTRLKLAALLVSKPDILYLDEPTNHLDIQAIEWLEGFLQDFSGSVLVISHDRRFLDNVATRILELRHGKIRSFPGNYANYLTARSQADATWEAAYQKQQEYIAQTEAYIRRFKAGIKSKQARGRQSQLDRLERIEAPGQTKSLGKMQFQVSKRSGQQVLQWKNLTKRYGEETLFADISGQIRRGEKIALLGANGSGKTTLIKLFLGMEQPEQGEVKLGSGVKIGYFSQELKNLDENKTLIDEIIDKFLLEKESARTYLGQFLFSEDRVFEVIKNLSGGEKARLIFLELLLSGANFLLLDEPTNHLDIESQEVWEEILTDFDGTILFISHDRHFIDKLAQRVLVLEAGNLQDYPGNYSYYQGKVEALRQQAAEAELAAMVLPRTKEVNSGRMNEKKRQQEAKKLKQQIREVEEEITALEAQVGECEQQLGDPDFYADGEQARRLTLQYNETQAALQAALEKWERLQLDLLTE